VKPDLRIYYFARADFREENIPKKEKMTISITIKLKSITITKKHGTLTEGEDLEQLTTSLR
jgi:hypothetical protein